jgi:hypothetical protein
MRYTNYDIGKPGFGRFTSCWLGLKIAQQLQCWARDATNRQSPLRTKEMFCRPWRDFMNHVRLPPAVNCWAIFENCAMTQAVVTEINAL